MTTVQVVGKEKGLFSTAYAPLGAAIFSSWPENTRQRCTGREWHDRATTWSWENRNKN